MQITLRTAVATGLAIALAGNAQRGVQAAEPAPTSHVTLLAGGPQWLIYGATRSLTAPSAHEVEPTTVYARSKAGKTITLETVDNVAVGQGWSINSGVVTTVKESNSNARQHVQWWDLSSGEKGVYYLSRAHRWAGSAPGGWLLLNKSTGYAGVQSVSTLKLTSLHEPYGRHFGALGHGPKGVVVNKLDAHLNPSHDFAYLRFAHPTTPVKLHSGANICDVITATTAFCEHAKYDNNDDESNDALSIQVMPLSSGRVHSPSPFHGAPQVAAGAQAVSFETPPSSGSATKAYFLSAATHYSARSLGVAVPSGVVPAYGAALYTVTGDGSTVYSISTATSPPVAVFSAG